MHISDIRGGRVSLHDGDSLMGRLGLAADYRSAWKSNDGLMVNTSVYGIANVYQAFLGGTTVNVSGIDFYAYDDRVGAGIGAGDTHAWANNKYAFSAMSPSTPPSITSPAVMPSRGVLASR